MKKLVFLTLAVLGVNGYAQQETQSVVEQPDFVSAKTATSEHINFLHQREWVRLGDDGNVGGKLLVLDQAGHTEGRIGAKVIVSRDGQAILETTTDVGGAFQLKGLKPGTYAIQSRGEYTFAAYALHVLPSSASHLSSDLEMYASVIPTARATELLSGNLVPSDLEAASDVYYRNFDKDPIAGERKFNNSARIALRGGILVGRVSRPGWTYSEQDLSGTIAQIVQAGRVVGKTTVGKDGYYEFNDVKPGVYDLFVSGDDGYAVLAFEAVAGDQPVAVKTSGVHMVSAQVGMASDCLSCELIQQPEMGACSTCGSSPIMGDPAFVDGGFGGAPSMGGGYAGGFGGGFGGGGMGGGMGGGGGGLGGGIGGLGGLLGIAGLAVGVTALSNNDNGFTVAPATPVVTP